PAMFHQPMREDHHPGDIIGIGRLRHYALPSPRSLPTLSYTRSANPPGNAPPKPPTTAAVPSVRAVCVFAAAAMPSMAAANQPPAMPPLATSATHTPTAAVTIAAPASTRPHFTSFRLIKPPFKAIPQI